MTLAQQKVIDRLKVIGGAGWLGDSVNRETEKFDVDIYIRVVSKVYGKKEADRLKKSMAKYGVTDQAVWCSSVTFQRLREIGAIVPIEEISGCWRLPN